MRALNGFGAALVLISASVVLTGCGGGNKAQQRVTTQKGRITFLLRWPSPSRLLPAGTQFVRVSIYDPVQGANAAPSQTVPRGNGATTAVTFTNLPVGNLRVTLEAFASDPNTAPVPVPTAVTTQFIALQPGDNNPAQPIILDSTVASMTLSGPPVATPGQQNILITAIAKNGDGDSVPVAKGTITFQSSDNTVLAVKDNGDNTATVTAGQTGFATITALYTEKTAITAAFPLLITISVGQINVVANTLPIGTLSVVFTPGNVFVPVTGSSVTTPLTLPTGNQPITITAFSGPSGSGTALGGAQTSLAIASGNNPDATVSLGSNVSNPNVTISIPNGAIALQGDIVAASVSATLNGVTVALNPTAFNWSSSNPALADVDANGVVTTKLPGDIRITASPKYSTLPVAPAALTVHAATASATSGTIQ